MSTVRTDESVEGRLVRVPDRPIPLEAFLDLPEDCDLELVGGVLVKRMAAQLEHERLFMWLSTILNMHVSQRGLGIVLGSRTAVETNPFGARIPDILFVRRERMEIVHERAVLGAPDLIVEIISPNDRPSRIIELETEYRNLGVPEIWFIDRRRNQVRVLHRRDGGYEEAECHEGPVPSESVPGFQVHAEWLLTEQRPREHEVLASLTG